MTIPTLHGCLLLLHFACKKIRSRKEFVGARSQLSVSMKRYWRSAASLKNSQLSHQRYFARESSCHCMVHFYGKEHLPSHQNTRQYIHNQRCLNYYTSMYLLCIVKFPATIELLGTRLYAIVREVNYYQFAPHIIRSFVSSLESHPLSAKMIESLDSFQGQGCYQSTAACIQQTQKVLQLK